MQSLRGALFLVVAAVLVEAGQYDYDEVLHKGLLFYQAQRSGRLSGMDPLLYWREDSGLKDRGRDGEDLTGGYYDAGDSVKFGLPMAYTITALSWGVLDYEGGYEAAGQLDEVRAAIQWGTDYFLKAHVSKNEFYGQVGSGFIDHLFWGRPEQMFMPRPAYKLDPEHPGSDVAGETAAALAAASLVFKSADPSYSETLLKHAKELYAFADLYQGVYTKSIPDAVKYYNSSGFVDELAWGALWLYRATGEESYLAKGEEYYNNNGLQYSTYPMNWDAKGPGATAMLAKLSSNSKYKNALQSFCDHFYYSQTRTPKGLIYVDKWGSLRLAANGVFVCNQASDLGIKTEEYRAEGKKQIDYMLGDGGRSYVVGFGNNPPTHAHHRAASCPDIPAPCTVLNYISSHENYHILYGALVGGPDENDEYSDRRLDYVHNEVACDYNAAFLGDLAALKIYGY